MNKLFPIVLALLFFGCDDILNEDDVYGCTIENACNFNPDANVFDDSCIYLSQLINAGFCDCYSNIIDECGDCGGNNEECEEFIPLLITDYNADVLDGPEDESFSNCPFLSTDESVIDIGSVYPNPFTQLISIDFEIFSNLQMQIKIIDDDYNDVIILRDREFYPGLWAVQWDGLNSEGNEVPDRYYRIIFTYNDTECYYNIKKQAE